MPLFWLSASAGLAAIALDRYFGEPPRHRHPLVGFGKLARTLEQFTNNGSTQRRYLLGLMSWLTLVAAPAGLCWWLASALYLWQPWLWWLFACGVLYFSLGLTSLREHALAIAKPLATDDLNTARHALQMIVSRDTSSASREEIASATVESVLENGSDAVFCALFWFAVLGPAGALLWRLTNTLDAMWGYRTTQLQAFGWAAARCDDLLALLPARISALLFAALGNTRQALRCWREQAAACKSPNGGPIMCAGAGSLGLILGGRAVYHGQERYNPVMGCGHPAQAEDISRALTLVQRCTVGWLVLVPVIATLCWPVWGLL